MLVCSQSPGLHALAKGAMIAQFSPLCTEFARCTPSPYILSLSPFRAKRFPFYVTAHAVKLRTLTAGQQ